MLTSPASDLVAGRTLLSVQIHRDIYDVSGLAKIANPVLQNKFHFKTSAREDYKMLRAALLSVPLPHAGSPENPLIPVPGAYCLRGIYTFRKKRSRLKGFIQVARKLQSGGSQPSLSPKPPALLFVWHRIHLQLWYRCRDATANTGKRSVTFLGTMTTEKFT